MKNRFTIIIAVALLIGVATTFIAYGKIKQQQARELELVPIVVCADNIEAYSVIASDNIKTENVSSKFVDEFTATSKEQLNGKIAIAPIFKGKPIDIRLLSDRPSEIGNKQVVGVHIDAVRFAGVTEGDTVDVYWLEGAEETPVPASKIANNAKVLKVSGDNAKSVTESAVIPIGLSEKTPQIIYLMIDPEEVPYVIRGSIPKNTSIALSKKPVLNGQGIKGADTYEPVTTTEQNND